jgi:hypothetical protein
MNYESSGSELKLNLKLTKSVLKLKVRYKFITRYE